MEVDIEMNVEQYEAKKNNIMFMEIFQYWSMTWFKFTDEGRAVMETSLGVVMVSQFQGEWTSHEDWRALNDTGH